MPLLDENAGRAGGGLLSFGNVNVLHYTHQRLYGDDNAP